MMDPNVFYQVVVPLMGMKKTATLMISTPRNSTNFYSELLEAKTKDGESIVNVMFAGMVCERCRMSGKKAAECPHPKTARPKWKTDTAEKTTALMAHRTDLIRNELHGEITSGQNAAFSHDHLRRFFGRALHNEPHLHTRTVYVSVDPNGGHMGGAMANNSETAVVSFFFDGANMIVSWEWRSDALRAPTAQPHTATCSYHPISIVRGKRETRAARSTAPFSSIGAWLLGSGWWPG